VNHHHRHPSDRSSGNNGFLFDDIDDELDGQESGDDVNNEHALRSTLSKFDQEPPPLTTANGMVEAKADVAEAQKCGEEDACDSDDDLFLSLIATRSDVVSTEATESTLEAGTLFPEWDWGELDEFDPEDDEEADEATAHLVIDPAGERIAIHDKAERAAAKIVKDANWEREEGLPVLTEILIHHRCHPKTIGALRELTIEHRVKPEMLMMLHGIRSAWRSYGYNRVYSALGAHDGWTNLPWGMSLHITETLGVQSEHEVMEFCELCFDDWCEVGFSEYPIFAYYLNFVVSMIDSPLVDTIYTAPYISRAMLTDRGEQYDLPGNPVEKDLEYYGIR